MCIRDRHHGESGQHPGAPADPGLHPARRLAGHRADADVQGAPSRRPDCDRGQEPAERQPGRTGRGRHERAQHRQEDRHQHSGRTASLQHVGGVVPPGGTVFAHQRGLPQPGPVPSPDRVPDRVTRDRARRRDPPHHHEPGRRGRGGAQHQQSGLARCDEPEPERALAEHEQPGHQHHGRGRQRGEPVEKVRNHGIPARAGPAVIHNVIPRVLRSGSQGTSAERHESHLPKVE